jgi:hypothetical protein
MRFWIMLLSFVMAAAVTAGASAQETKQKGKGRHRLTFAEMDTNKDGKLTKDEFMSAHMARLKDAPEARQEKAKEFLPRMWERLTKDAKDKNAITEAEYNAAVEKIAKDWKQRKQKGDKGGPTGG